MKYLLFILALLLCTPANAGLKAVASPQFTPSLGIGSGYQAGYTLSWFGTSFGLYNITFPSDSLVHTYQNDYLNTTITGTTTAGATVGRYEVEQILGTGLTTGGGHIATFKAESQWGANGATVAKDIANECSLSWNVGATGTAQDRHCFDALIYYNGVGTSGVTATNISAFSIDSTSVLAGAVTNLAIYDVPTLTLGTSATNQWAFRNQNSTFLTATSGKLVIGSTAMTGTNTQVLSTGRVLITGGVADPADGSPPGLGLGFNSNVGDIQAVQAGVSQYPLRIQSQWPGPGFGVGVTFGSNTLPVNLADFFGGIAIGSSYAGVNTAPVSGALIQGNVGIGTTSILTGSKLSLAGHLGFTTISIPVITACGSGALAAGSTDNKGQITGITAATACTITFGTAMPAAPACTFATSTGIAAGGIPTTAAVTTTMAALTGTLAYICF